MAKTDLQKKFERDIKTLNDSEITYFSINLNAIKDDKGKYKFNEHGGLLKKPTNVLSYKNVKVESYFNKKYNGTMIPLGKNYNLIGIDVDNKNDTINKFNKIRAENEAVDTFTIKTMNNGYHYYYYLSKQQASKLKNFCSQNDALFGLKIDVKYTNQVFFGPTILTADKEYQFKIINKTNPIQLPDFIYSELLKNISKDKKLQKKKEKFEKEEVIEKEINEKEKTLENDRLSLYLNCLKDSRWNNYEDWFKLGSVIFNSGGSYELFETYSKRSNKFDKNECKNKWEQIRKCSKGKISIGTLVKMAKEDNFKEFIKTQQKDIEYILYTTMIQGLTDRETALLYYYMHTDMHIYDTDQNQFYSLNEHNIWLKDSNFCDVSRRINETLLPKVTEFFHKTINTCDPYMKSEVLEILGKNKKYLLANKSKKAIINELLTLYQERDIFPKMDNVNLYVFAFKNGVFDFKENKFRAALPTELLTFTVDYDYEEVSEEIKKDMNYIYNNFLLQIFPNEKVADYMLYTLAQCLVGEGTNEKFYFWKGSGRNGKGTLRDLIMYTFCKYYDSLDINYLNKTKHDQSSATSAITPIMR
jgi:hypothetical protein